MKDFFYNFRLTWRRLLEYLGILRVIIDIGNEEIRIIEAFRFLFYFKILSTSAEKISDTTDINFAIERFIERFTTHPIKRINLTLSSTSIIPLFLNFPGIPKEKIQSAILWEIERNIPLPLEEAYYSYKVVSRVTEDGKNVWNVLAVVAKKDEVDRYLNAFRKMNIIVEEVSYLPINILSAIDLPGSENAVGYVYISEHSIELYIILEKKIISFNHYIGDFSKFNAVTIRNIVDYFADFIKRRISFLERITVITRREQDKNLIVDSLMDSLNIFTMPVEKEDFLAQIKNNNDESTMFDLLGFSYKCYLDLQIEPQKVQKTYVKDKLQRSAIVLFMFLDLLSLIFVPKMIVSAQKYNIIQQARSAESLESISDSVILAMAETLESIDTLTTYKSNQQDLLYKIQEIESLGIDSSNLKVILAEICRLMPTEIWLESFVIDESEGEMIGYSTSSDSLESFVVYLVESRVINDVVLTRAELYQSYNDTQIEFSISFEVIK